MITRRSFLAGLASLPLVFTGQGKKKGHHKMSNGLLVGLTEAWEPSSGVVLVGQKAGLTTGTDATLSYVVQAAFPTGHAIQSSDPENSAFLNSPASALLSEIGMTDFLWLSWVVGNLHMPIAFIGESGPGNNGVNWNNTAGPYTDLPNTWSAFFPGTDGNYSFGVSTAPNQELVAATPLMLALYYTTADSTLHISTNAGTVYTGVNSAGVGVPDLTNFLSMQTIEDNEQVGPQYLWQGTAGAANAWGQLSTIYGSKLQYSDFDSGGGSTHASFFFFPKGN